MMRRTSLIGAIVLSALLALPALNANVDDVGAGTRKIEQSDYTMYMNLSDAATTAFTGGTPYSYLGYYHCGGQGDINGDGIDDLVIVDPNNDTQVGGVTVGGVVSVYFGGPHLAERQDNRSPPDVLFYGPSGSYTGESACIPGDLNLDGIDDLVISSPTMIDGTSSGKVHIFFGKRSGWKGVTSIDGADASFLSEGSSVDYFGKVVSGLGDVNGDGWVDLGISYPYLDWGGQSTLGKVFVVFGGRSEWERNMSIFDADASFVGRDIYDMLGCTMSGAGDVNGDGLDDFIIGAPWADHVSSYDGEVSLIFGRTDGWGQNVSVSAADVNFGGEGLNDYLGLGLSGGSDVNGDGLDDIMIGAPYNKDGSPGAGKVYLIFGRTEGWASEFDLSLSDATFLGEKQFDYLASVSIETDVNMDGLADILLGAVNSDHNSECAGQVYLFYGRSDGWGIEMNLSKADASFVGEYKYDNAGTVIWGVGDVIGDGYPGFMISASDNDEGSYMAGKVYLISGGINFEPLEITSLRAFRDPDYSEEVSIADLGEVIYLELIGKDGNSSNRNAAYVNLTLNQSHPREVKMVLRETDIDSGVYRGMYAIPLTSIYGEQLSAKSVNDPLKAITITVDTPVRIGPIPKSHTIDQDQHFSVQACNLGYSDEVTWTFDTDAEWLSFSQETLTISGDPDNSDVGKWSMTLNLTDGAGHYSLVISKIEVRNLPPTILTENEDEAFQGTPYLVDYDCDEDGHGEMSWSLGTEMTWLDIDSATGVLEGMPGPSDVGTYQVWIWVNDGNGAKDQTVFNMTVVDVNDRPQITTSDITEVYQGEPYQRTYEATDLDPSDMHVWALETNAGWLNMSRSGLLKGTPGPDDVGMFDVKVIVTDSRGLYDVHMFRLEVKNMNDAPYFERLPGPLTLKHGETFIQTIDARDHDKGDVLRFSMETEPFSNMTIDEYTGKIVWRASMRWFDRPPYMMKVALTVSDGSLSAKGSFEIEVLPSTRPNTILAAPQDGGKVSAKLLSLEWSGSDLENDPLTYDVYLGDTKAFVSALKEETLYAEMITEGSLEVHDLMEGRTYYWTVIPNDGCLDGTCNSGIRSFRLNTAPVVDVPELQTIEAGSSFRFVIKAEDGDPEDKIDLGYSLLEGPLGMTIGEDTGVISWEPEADQVMMHKIVIGVSDGIDVTEMTFTIEVVDAGKEGGSKLPLIAGACAIVLLVVVSFAVVLVLMKGRRNARTKEEREIERPFDVDDDDDVKDDEGSDNRFKCDVPLTPAEAHAKLGKGSRAVSYEDLYGVPRPKEERGMDAVELKNYIHDQIEEMEMIPEE